MTVGESECHLSEWYEPDSELLDELFPEDDSWRGGPVSEAWRPDSDGEWDDDLHLDEDDPDAWRHE